ncbi:MAG TPA: hypothetical protein VGC30_15850 [Dokdonella sp.]
MVACSGGFEALGAPHRAFIAAFHRAKRPSTGVTSRTIVDVKATAKWRRAERPRACPHRARCRRRSASARRRVVLDVRERTAGVRVRAGALLLFVAAAAARASVML